MIALTAAAAILVLLLVIGGSLLRQGAWRRAAAYQVGEESYSAAEVGWYYYSAYNSMEEEASGYTQLLGVDPEQSLAHQDCPLSDRGESWRDYLLRQAVSQLEEVSSLYQEARKEGYTVSDAAAGYAQNAREYWEMTAVEEGFDGLEQYLAALYGGIRTGEFQRLLEEGYTARQYRQQYMDSLEFTEEELYSYFKEHESEFHTFSYLYSFLGTDGHAAEEIGKAGNEAEFRELAKELTGTGCYELSDMTADELGSAESEDVMWLTDPKREKGDVWYTKSGDNWYALCFLESGGAENWQERAAEKWREDRAQKWTDTLVKKYNGHERFGLRFVGN